MTFFLICQRVWKTVKCQAKIREKSGNFEVDDKWQPCTVSLTNSLVSDSFKSSFKHKIKCTDLLLLLHFCFTSTVNI